MQKLFFPEQVSTFAGAVDFLFFFIFWISVFFFVLVVGMMTYFVLKYRRVEGQEPEHSHSHNTPLEVTWSVVPGILVLIIFALGFVPYMDMRSPPADTYEINVTANMWNWNFRYPTGAVSGELHVPIGTPVKLVMRSQDVLHSLYVPAFRVKQDVVPGRYTGMWFEATKTGTYDLFCAEYCGQKHSDMITKVVAHALEREALTEPGEQTFDEWMEIASDPGLGADGKPIPPHEAGERVVGMFGCMQCHSDDGTKKVGPSFKGYYGKEVDIVNMGKVPMDEEYIRESILEPNAKIRLGYEPKMPSFKGQMKDEWIDFIIAYIKHMNQ